MRRRRPVGKRIYTLNYLLDKQPKALKKHENYQLMISYLNSSPGIMAIRFNRRCYSLLHNAVIKPEHLENFYRTYRLPRSPFFPLFFMIKREYLEQRKAAAEDRRLYINSRMEQLPAYVKEIFSEAMTVESVLAGGTRCPVYRKRYLPGTRRKADQYGKFSHGEWIRFFDAYLGELGTRYERLPLREVEFLSASMALRCPPSLLRRGSADEILNRQYRELSKECHPDRGGDADLFIKVKWARDLLSRNSPPQRPSV